ncbi:MarR family winged helix-turn-helix transcriptional regulator [Frondihabitans cladoniiphilus]|uniref:HTH marR-type domain-containing protein n=1 Tax=Frondihabitans cladoniiphilus TaxID=715785 RepID=A0ABP8VS78_9MICO
MTNPEPTQILESLISSTTRLVRIAAQRSGRTMSSATARTLSILSTDGPLRIGELARASRISQPGMTKLLRSMIDEEQVSRIAHEDDQRAWLITITPKGLEAMTTWRATLAAEMGPLFDDLTDEEWDALATSASLLEARSSREEQFA